MKTFKNLIGTAFLLFIISCSGKSEDTESSSEFEPKASNDASCIFSYIGKYDQLLPIETIQKHYNIDLANARKKYQISKDVKSQVRDTYVYSWKSDRTKTVEFGGNKMVLPISNQIGLKWLGDDLYKIMDKGNSLASFKAFYKNVSKTEMQAALSQAEEQVSKDKNIDEATKNTAIDMAQGMSKEAKFVEVNGVGDAAAWVVSDNSLVVLVGDKTFQILAEISADSQANKKVAIELAKEVLKKCE
jgi:hypothetical protein